MSGVVGSKLGNAGEHHVMILKEDYHERVNKNLREDTQRFPGGNEAVSGPQTENSQ